MAADGLQGASEFDNERLLLSKLQHSPYVPGSLGLAACMSAGHGADCLQGTLCLNTHISL